MIEKSNVKTYKKDTKNNFFVPHAVIEDIKFKKLPDSAKILYIILCHIANRYADENGWFWRSLTQLQEDTGKSRKTIIKAKKLLKKQEFIDTEHTFYTHSKKRTYDSFRLNGFRFRSSEKNAT
jgi:hypothetical protein